MQYLLVGLNHARGGEVLADFAKHVAAFKVERADSEIV